MSKKFALPAFVHRVFFVFRRLKQYFDESEVKNSTLDEISDQSFLRLEKICEHVSGDDLLENISVPDFNETLEEVDFILSLGLKLKAEGKVNFPTPPLAKQNRPEENCDKSNHKDMSVYLAATAESSPKTSRSQIKPNQRRLTKVISPIPARCRSNIFGQNSHLSPTVK